MVWFGNNRLLLNVAKTKDTVVDFRRTKAKLNTISILGEEVVEVERFKYLGVHMDNKLDWGTSLRLSTRRVRTGSIS